MAKKKMTTANIEDAVFDGLKQNLVRHGVHDVWFSDLGPSVGRNGQYFDARFSAVIATDLGAGILYYLSVEPEYTADQIAAANDTLAGIFAQASSRREELKSVLDIFREKMPAFCAALSREGIEAHLVDARLCDLVPTAAVCHLLPSMRFSWRSVHGKLIVGEASSMDADDAFSSVVFQVAEGDESLAKRLLGLLGQGALGYSPTGTKIADRIEAMGRA